jgi:uncharacterized protein YndB with AHSA1/START domain
MDTHAHALEHELVMTRRIPAPPAAVFAAWTEAERIKQWWGPAGMTVPEAAVELRPGGLHRAVMRDAAGQDHPCLTVVEAVEVPHRLVVRVPEEAGGPLVGATAEIRFDAEGGEGTRLTVRWRHPTAGMRAAHEAMGFARGWAEMLDKLTAHAMTPPPGTACPMAAPLAPEHGWLHRLLGEWSYAIECMPPPGQDGPMRASGVERVRSLGGYWVIGEAEGTAPGGGDGVFRSVITMGFDPDTRRFKGSWAGSMMPHMFLYDGALDAEGRVLTLDAEGPSFTGEGTARYRDIVELRGEDHRLLISEVQGQDGGWTRIMTGEFRRLR